MTTTKKIIKKSPPSNQFQKPSTVTRAAITANIKYTRGKELVEHSPFDLIPDPNNPRPNEIINDQWLKRNLYLGSDNSLCRLNATNGAFEIPLFSALNIEDNSTLEESYSFLRDLAFSIRSEGLIEPIEIFLADKNNEPEYFKENNLEYGYVVLEGHQRRLAAIMSGVSTVTCIEITDESMLAKLKIKHRKLRRQLSENNLRKNLTPGQNFQIIFELLSFEENNLLTASEVSNIIGLNEKISQALIKICRNIEEYPPIMISMIKEEKLTFKSIRQLVSKSYDEIEKELSLEIPKVMPVEKKQLKSRGRQGGAVKKSATFKVKDIKETSQLQKLLLDRFPEFTQYTSAEPSFKSLEEVLIRIKDMALAYDL